MSAVWAFVIGSSACAGKSSEANSRAVTENGGATTRTTSAAGNGFGGGGAITRTIPESAAGNGFGGAISTSRGSGGALGGSTTVVADLATAGTPAMATSGGSAGATAAGGSAGAAAGSTCVPRECGPGPYCDCGLVDDGCGNTIVCGTCGCCPVTCATVCKDPALHCNTTYDSENYPRECPMPDGCGQVMVCYCAS